MQTRPPAGPSAPWATRRSTPGPSLRRRGSFWPETTRESSGSRAGAAWARPCASTQTRPWRVSWPWRSACWTPRTPYLGKSPKPNPSDLYPSGVQASMPEPTEQLTSTLPVQLTRADKDALDLLAAWPLCTREQLAGLMGGVTLRRVNQVLRSLTQHGLVRADEPLHMLTDEGLTYLARRDRAAVGLTLDRWSAEPLYLNAGIYAGTAVRALRLPASSPHRRHQLRRCPVRQGRPLPGPRPVRPAAHVPLQHRLPLRLDHLRHPSRRLLHPGIQRPVASLPAGVRAAGHNAEACPLPPEVLPAVLPGRMR